MAKGSGLVLFGAAAVGLFLVTRKGSASGERARCLQIAAEGTADLLILEQEQGTGAARSIEALMVLLESVGSKAAAKCVRDNPSALRKCRSLLIAGLKRDLRSSTDEDLTAQADMARTAGAPPEVVDCLMSLAGVEAF